MKIQTKKQKEWTKAKARLIQEYIEKDITSCEARHLNDKCLKNLFLSLHHIERRSSNKAQHTFEGTRLLCAECHHLADNAIGHEEFNYKLKQLR